MSIGSRIKELRIKRNITQEELARQIGVTKGAIANYENEISSPKIDLMYKLFEALDCDANYLHQDDMKTSAYKETSTPEEFENIIKKYRALDDPGRSHVDTVLKWESDRMEQLKQTPSAIVELHNSSNEKGRLIDYYRSVSAGTGEVIFDDVYFERITLPDIPEYRRVAYAVKVDGRSMEPLYNDGDVLLIEPTCEVEVGEIGIFNVDGKAYVKKLGKEKLISLNKGYGDIQLTEDSLCMGRVVGKL